MSDNNIPLSELCKNLKKKPSKLNKKPENIYDSISQNNNNNNKNNINNYDNLKSTIAKTSVSKNDETSLSTKVVVDEREINKIIKNYKANLLISSFRKLSSKKSTKLHFYKK